MMKSIFKSVIVFSLVLMPLMVVAEDTVTQQPQMIYEIVSPYDFDKTNQIIVDGIKSEHWKIPKIYDWQSIAKAGGHDPGQFNMYDLCKAKYAAGIFKHEHLRFVSTLMPCATSVYTKSDGKTYVAYMNVDLLGQMFGEELADIARQAGESRDRVLSGLREH